MLVGRYWQALMCSYKRYLQMNSLWNIVEYLGFHCLTYFIVICARCCEEGALRHFHLLSACPMVQLSRSAGNQWARPPPRLVDRRVSRGPDNRNCPTTPSTIAQRNTRVQRTSLIRSYADSILLVCSQKLAQTYVHNVPKLLSLCVCMVMTKVNKTYI